MNATWAMAAGVAVLLFAAWSASAQMRPPPPKPITPAFNNAARAAPPKPVAPVFNNAAQGRKPLTPVFNKAAQPPAPRIATPRPVLVPKPPAIRPAPAPLPGGGMALPPSRQGQGAVVPARPLPPAIKPVILGQPKTLSPVFGKAAQPQPGAPPRQSSGSGGFVLGAGGKLAPIFNKAAEGTEP